MFDIVLLCIITGFIIYKLYTKFGMYNNNDIEVRNKFFDAKKTQTKKQIQSPILENHLVAGTSNSVEKIATESQKEDVTFDKQKLVQEQLNENNRTIEKISTLLSQDAKQNLVDFYGKYPRFDFEMMKIFVKDFFELFFESFYKNNLEKLAKFITPQLLQSLLAKTILQNDVNQDIKNIDLLYKIEEISLYDVIYTKSSIIMSFNATSLKISYQQDGHNNVVSGSKKNPLRFSNKLTFIKTFKEQKDEQLDWMLQSIE